MKEESIVETTDEGERTVKVRFRKGWDRSTFSANDVEDLFSRYGNVENVILGKSALVVFVTVSQAKAATKATSSGDPAFAMVKEITMVQMSASPPATTNVEINGETSQYDASQPAVAPQVTPPIVPQKAPVISSAPKFSFKPSVGNSNGADYESVTLLRMRKIEKERLEKEIREREEKEDQVVV